MKKILIFYASYGSGHKTVANYIYNSLKEKDYDVSVIDLLDYSNFVGKVSTFLFNLNIKYKSSLIYSGLYKLFDNKVTTKPYKSVFKKIINTSLLENRIIEFEPNLIISTHFFGTTIKSILDEKGLINSKLISIITDYTSHELWEKDDKDNDYYVVANKMIKNSLVSKGVDKNKIFDYGIPVSNIFKHIDDNRLLKKKFKVNNTLKTILFFGGGSLGSNYTYHYLRRLLECNYECNIIFVCGKNIKLKKKCDEYLKNNYKENVQIYGFTNEVNSLISIADFVITKPGGISVTECLNIGVPLLLIPGNGGQEVYNAKYVIKNGFGTYARNSKSLCKNVNKLLESDRYLEKYKKNIMRYGHNNSLDKLEKLVDKTLRDR